MTHAKRLWSIWQALLSAFAWAFTGPSFRRFAEWVTAMAINGEEHTITQSVLALERPADWKALESFAEYGAWHPDYVTASLTRLVETAPGRLWHGYHISAVDDTKVHRNSPDVWGTCTFHEYTARCPNRAPTVRAHNWVVLGALLDNPGQPPWCLPLSGRLYFRKSQLPLQAQDSDHTVVFRTKCELVVELIREQARITGGRHLGIFDGAYALRSVVRPLVQPEPGHPRIEFLTRLRPDGNEREVLTHPERLILTHLVLQDSRSGQGRQFRFTPPFGSSWTSSTRESGSSRRSSRRSGNDASGGPKAPRSSARPGRSGSTR